MYVSYIHTYKYNGPHRDIMDLYEGKYVDGPLYQRKYIDAPYDPKP